MIGQKLVHSKNQHYYSFLMFRIFSDLLLISVKQFLMVEKVESLWLGYNSSKDGGLHHPIFGAFLV